MQLDYCALGHDPFSPIIQSILLVRRSRSFLDGLESEAFDPLSP
jgi:hypothetical protein